MVLNLLKWAMFNALFCEPELQNEIQDITVQGQELWISEINNAAEFSCDESHSTEKQLTSRRLRQTAQGLQ
jgi:hypothetical protein